VQIAARRGFGFHQFGNVAATHRPMCLQYILELIALSAEVLNLAFQSLALRLELLGLLNRRNKTDIVNTAMQLFTVDYGNGAANCWQYEYFDIAI